MQHQSKYNILTRRKSSTFLFGLYLFMHTGVQHDFISDDVHVFQQ
jgi:hypothetical protein